VRFLRVDDFDNALCVRGRRVLRERVALREMQCVYAERAEPRAQFITCAADGDGVQRRVRFFGKLARERERLK
jgi:hypothetical protein